MNDEDEIKKTSPEKKNYENMDISELNIELIELKKTLKIVKEIIKSKQKGQNIAEKIFKK